MMIGDANSLVSRNFCCPFYCDLLIAHCRYLTDRYYRTSAFFWLQIYYALFRERPLTRQNPLQMLGTQLVRLLNKKCFAGRNAGGDPNCWHGSVDAQQD